MQSDTFSDVPKIIHQIWVGPRPIPTKWTQTWEKFCTENGFTYKLWGEAEINTLLKHHPAKDLYDTQQQHSAKSDIARFEILAAHGGIYVDADTVFLSQNVKHLLNWKGLVVVPDPDPNNKLIRTGIIGCTQGHPFIKFLSETMNTVIGSRQKMFGYAYEASWITTGPAYFSEAFLLMKPEASILDPLLFYPSDWGEKDMEKSLDEIRREHPKAATFHYGYGKKRLHEKTDNFTL